MNITVLAGGVSPEREVSLSSGSLIANALAENGHRVLLLDLALGYPDLPSDPTTLFGCAKDRRYFIGATEPNPDYLLRARKDGAVMGPHVAEICALSDAVFLALHGGAGENGQVQAMLDCIGVPYTGSGYDGSLLAMDKDLTKRLLRDAGVPTPEWALCESDEINIDEWIAKVGFPCVVKPADGGSSIGVSFAGTREKLVAAIERAKKYSRRLLVERKIVGRELTVGILGVRVLPPVEMIPKEGFYDYRNKYAGTTEELCPAPISEEVNKRLSEYASRAFRILRLRGYARFDFLLDKEERLWCLEANTLPGMTPTSLFPREAAALGISYRALCETLLQMALNG